MTTCPACSAVLEPDAQYCGACGGRLRVRRPTLVGTRVDERYRVDAKIAEGGFGAIYRATHVGGHEVALKVLHADLASDPFLAARFRREAATLACLRDPHTVATYEHGETADGTLYIAMELLRGESLLDRFTACGPLPWRSVLAIAKAVCSSLAEAHALGIVHRDLKPGNIYLDRGDHVKVLDFGIAKLMRGSDSDDGSELTRVGQAIGTLEYMAPEQLIGGTCDGRSDIYTLGLVMYEMLTGRRPFADATGPTSLITAVMTQPVPPPSTLIRCDRAAKALDALVLRCLAGDPTERFANVGEVVAAIEHVLDVPASARGAWSVELSDDDDITVVDVVPVPAPQRAPHVIMQPVASSRLAPLAVPAPAHRAYERSFSYHAVPHGPVTHVGPAARHREPTPFGIGVEGSTVGPPPPAPAPPPPAATSKWRAVRLAGWAIGLLTGGAGLGMAIASLLI